jgi:hypothetical protein
MNVSIRGSLVLAMTAAAICGAGCKSPFKQSTQEPAEYSKTTSTSAVNVQPAKAAPTEQEVRADLRAALQNFHEAKSFRANVTLKTSEGTFKARMDMQKPNRVRGQYDLRPGTRVDMIAVDSSLFMRFNDDPWANISKIPSAQTLSNAMKDSLTGNSSLDNLGVDDALPVKRTVDRSRKCDLYSTTLTDKEGKAYEVEICVADGLPKFLELKSPTNPLKVEYSDYNTVFLIEKPAN